MLTIAFVLGGVLLGFALLLGGLYELGKYCNRKPRTKPGSVLSEPLLCDVDDGIAADALAAAADPMPSNAWSEKSRIVIPFPKERLAQLQIERLVNDAGVLNGPAQLPPLLRSVGEAGTPSDFRNEGIGWLSMPVSHRAELWVALLSRYGPLGSAASVTSGASSVCSDGKDGEHNDKSVVNPLLASPSASAYGIHVQHQDDADLISFDARRCKFSKYRVEPYAGRLEWLIRKWVRENPSCQYYQSLNVVAAVVLEVFEEDLSTAFAAFQRVVDVFLSGLLHKQALHKVAEVRRLSQFLLVLGFWDPELAVQLCDLELGPELYAIPWLSTLFADSLELVDALRVWDIMLCLDARYPVFLAVSFLQQARSSLLKVRDTFAGLQALNLVKDSETSFARIADCARAAVGLWSSSPQSVGHVDSGPLTAQVFVKAGYRRTASTRAAGTSVELAQTPNRSVSLRSGGEIVLATGDVAEFDTPKWTPQFEPWYSPSSAGAQSPSEGSGLLKSPPRLRVRDVEIGTVLDSISTAQLQQQPPVAAKAPAPASTSFLSVDLSAISTYDVSVDVLSPFVSPTPTAAAACVIAGLYRKGSIAQLEDDASGSGSVDKVRPSDEVVSRDVLIGEVLPVARLAHLASLPPTSVCVVDIRNCSPTEHVMFATSIRRLAPYLRVLHCPAGDLKRPMSSPSLQSRPPASPGYSTEIEMLLKDREVSKRLDVSLSQAFRYTITGGLDVDTMNLAVGSSTEDPICMLTIASSMHCRSYQKFPGVRGGVAGTFAWLRSASPCLAALKGQCMALYADSDTASLALTRDALVRAGFVGVCGLSHTCFIANSLEET